MEFLGISTGEIYLTGARSTQQYCGYSENFVSSDGNIQNMPHFTADKITNKFGCYGSTAQI